MKLELRIVENFTYTDVTKWYAIIEDVENNMVLVKTDMKSTRKEAWDSILSLLDRLKQNLLAKLVAENR
jgi:hypothetical protein